MIISNVALSGAQFQAKRLAASAQNVAAATVGAAAPQAAEGSADRHTPLRVEGVSQAAGGVRGDVRPDPKDPERQTPESAERGVRLEEELVRAREAQHLHSANLRVMETERRMLGTLLDREV